MNITIVVLSLLGFLYSISALGKRYKWHSEWQRKVLHVGLGLTALSFPWLFTDVWQVVVLCSIACFILLLIRYVPHFRKSIGGCLHEVDRSSLGELLFAMSIVLLFWLSKGNIVLYIVPLSILTISDSLASIVGIYYGKRSYEVVDGIKSWEGTLAFALITFLIIVLLLYVLADLSWPVMLIIAATFAILGALVEAVSWHGFDNILIPFASFLFLDAFLQADALQLSYQFSVLAGLIVLGLVGGPICKFNTHTLMTSIIVLYLFWVVRDILWIAPPLIIFFVHVVIIRLMKIKEEGKFTIDAAMSVVSGGLFWILMEELFSVPSSFLLFICALTIHLHVILLLRLRDFRQKAAAPLIVLLIGLLSSVLILFPFTIAYYGVDEYQKVLSFSAFGIVVVLVVGMSMRTLDRLSRKRWIVEGILAAVGSASALIPLWIMEQ